MSDVVAEDDNTGPTDRLRSVNVNSINTYQQVGVVVGSGSYDFANRKLQVVLYLVPMICTPIFINTFVVFLRLYWFEKRFQHVVKEARAWRRTKSRSRTNTQMFDERDVGRENRGVNGRSITVLRDGQRQENQPASEFVDDKLHPGNGDDSAATSSATEEESPEAGLQDHESPSPTGPPRRPSTFHRDITFADEVKDNGNPASAIQTFPQQLSTEQHIAFLENQRNPKDKASLRIPGPRDFDRGDVPQTVDEQEDGGPLSKHVTSAEPLGHSVSDSDKTSQDPKQIQDGQQVKRNITIDVPNHPRLRAGRGGDTLSKFTSRKSGFSDKASQPGLDKAPSTARLRRRTSTFGSMKTSGSKEKDPMPYLSWQPTIGRNSAFVDLTEEQREELGGIEYRSLKTLALVLVGMLQSSMLGFHNDKSS